MRMTKAKMPTGSSKQADSMAAIIAVSRLVDDSCYSKGIIYEWDSSYIGQSDSAKYVFTAAATARYSWIFSDPKPTLIGDSTYIFGPWSATASGTTMAQRLTLTGTNEYWTQTGTWPTAPSPGTMNPLDQSAYVQVVLYYSDLPAGSNGRLRTMKLSRLAVEALESFAGAVRDWSIK